MTMSVTAAHITLAEPGGATVPATILGQNLEVTEKNAMGMLSNRVFNAKFAGPAETNGAPPPWRWASDFQHATDARLDANLALAPLASAQMLQNYRAHASGELDPRLMQTTIELLPRERVEVVLWARARHQPATILVSLNNSRCDLAPYGTETFSVDTTYWRRYRAEFDAPEEGDRSAVVSCALAGTGTVWIDQIQVRTAGESTIAQDVLDHLDGFPLPALRFPGGCLASNYRWRLGTGPVQERPSMFDTANRRQITYDFGTDEYLELCLRLGTRPHLTVNVGTGTPEEAGAWVRYVADWYQERTGEVPPMYVQVGNEDNGLHEHTNMTPQMYAQTLRDFVPAIRANHPSATIIALAEEVGRSLDCEETPWRATVLPVVAELEIEAVAIHIYEGLAVGDGVDQCEQAIAALASARRRFGSLVQDCDAAGTTAALAVTEWNYRISASHWDGPRGYERSGGTMHEDFVAPHAMFVAGFIEMLARSAPRVEVASFYNLMNGLGVFSRRGARVVRSELADIFELFQPALPGELVPATIQTDSTDEDRFGAFAVANDAGTWLFLCNRDPLTPVVVTCEMLAHAAQIDALVATDPLAPVTPRTDLAVAGSGLRVPPLAIVRVRA